MKFTTYFAIAALGTSGACATSIPSHAPSPIEGAWLMNAVHYVSEEETHSIDPAQPGTFQFHDGRYTIMWTSTRAPRTPFADLANPTDEETRAAFRSIVFNAGRYELDGDRLTTTAELARVPGFEGGVQYYHVEIAGDQLTLSMFDETYPDGSKPEWSGVWKTEFHMRRAD